MIARWILAVSALMVPSAAVAQPRLVLPQPTSRLELIQFLKSADPLLQAAAFETAVAILTGEVSRPDLSADVVARDLVDVAASDAPVRARTDAMAALIRSRDTDKAKPYAGAAERLAETYRRATDVRVKGVAMGGVFAVADPETALAFLIPIAERDDARFPREQAAAINLIAQLNTERSAAFLRDLTNRGIVTEEWARAALNRHAAAGYRAPREPRIPPG